MAVVYWIHLAEHTDMFTQGYIGVSKNTAKDRFKVHKHLATSGKGIYVINNAIRKYGDSIKLQTLVVADLQYCYDLERKLRPEINIGWNIARGGEQPPMTGRKHSDYTRKKMSDSSHRIRKPHSEEFKNRIRIANSGKKPWQNCKARKHIWLKAAEIAVLVRQNPKWSYKRLDKIFNGSTGRVIDMARAGWWPEKDPAWVEFKTDAEKSL
jgi:hypothetical protein